MANPYVKKLEQVVKVKGVEGEDAEFSATAVIGAMLFCLAIVLWCLLT